MVHNHDPYVLSHIHHPCSAPVGQTMARHSPEHVPKLMLHHACMVTLVRWLLHQIGAGMKTLSGYERPASRSPQTPQGYLEIYRSSKVSRNWNAETESENPRCDGFVRERPPDFVQMV